MLIESSLISYSNRQNLFVVRRNVYRYLTLCIWGIMSSTGCLPVDTNSPECFPAEDCERGKMCVAGRCVTPPKRSVKVILSCLSGEGCSDELSMHQVNEACLIIEQPHAIHSHPFALDKARFDGGATMMVPLMSGPVRSSVLLLTTPPEPSDLGRSICALDAKEIERYRLHRDCPKALGCILRLRREETSTLHTETDVLELSFDGPHMSCAESTWSIEKPEELCDGEDRDCDGFFDEGVQCLSPQDDLERPFSP